jgi:tRNA(Ile)-lysidine synthase
MDDAFSDILTHRLDGEGPLGVAVSGGGDSVALLYRLAEWGRRPLHVFCVDHGLNPASAGWTRGVADHARRVGATFTPLHWTGPKPRTGVSAAARQARHALLADAARTSGVRVLCLAHTRDDGAEAAWMRGQGSNVTAPAEWSPSPAWPQGRGVFLLRPLLNHGREDLREYLRARGIGWIDDPANANLQSLRARARLADKAGGAPLDVTGVSVEQMDGLLDRSRAGHGLIALNLSGFTALPAPLARRVLSAAAVCAGGGDRLPRGDSLDALIAGLGSGKTRTLCGARLWRDEKRLYICREAGDIGRNGAGRVGLTPGKEAIWDGRYAISAAARGTIDASGRARSRLNEADRVALRRLPAAVRGILPVLDEDFPAHGLSSIRLLGQCNETGLDCVDWVLPRFVAACGAVDRESRIGPDLAWP